MKVVVKPSTKNINDYIKKGANIFLLSLKDLSSFASVFFSHEEIIKIYDKYNVDIYLNIDKHMHNKDIDNLKIKLKSLEGSIKGVIFYDLSVLEIVKEEQLNIDLIWGPNFLVTNYETCNFYNHLGVKSVVISNTILFKDIENILKNVKFKCFINSFGYQLMSLSDRKLVSNYYKEIKEEYTNKKHYMIEKGNKYEIVENENCTFTLSNEIFDLSSYLDKIKKYDPYLILDEISIPHSKFLKVLDRYLKEKDIEGIVTTSNKFLDVDTIVKVK